MQKKRKKQAKNPFGLMKKKEDGEEKQELEFAEGFRRINYFYQECTGTNYTNTTYITDR